MKLGLEIHQRLDTHKLFCNCPSEGGNGKPKSVLRTLHPVYSEMGEVDKTSLAEAEREQTFEYLFYENCCCLVELDEEPPHPLNPEALRIGLEMALQLKSRPVDEVHVMRKTVIDGSNTAGFQRTAVIAMGGKVESANGDVRVSTVAIEEESAGIVERKEGRAVYSLDRLGIPLVEIGTEPDIKSPEHLREIAEKLGLMLRATGKVMRGLGTIRQDVNVSVEGGARVEIKGAQDLKSLALIAENEARRQEALLAIMKEAGKRFGGKVGLGGKILDAGDLFRGTSSKLLKTGLDSGQKALGMKLEKHAGLLGKEISPNRRYGTELSDYAKTTGVKGIIHSDEEMKKYGIGAEEFANLCKLLKMEKGDAFVLVIAPESVAKKALEKALERARMDYIPKETRKANEDGTSSFMRPLAGRARLYPETDIPPVRIGRELLDEIRSGASESLEQKREKLLKLLNRDMAERMLRSRNLKIFERLVEMKIEPTLAAATLEDTLTMLRREGVEVGGEHVLALFEEYLKGSFVKAAIADLLRETAKGKSVEEALEEKQLRKISGTELRKIIKENSKSMAAIMAKYRLRVDSKEVAELIKSM
ncbi:MAG: Glu-tRNA(Gln) amidotransferase subunit GatE [Candidatus ainarchaeum sp.]|nr:Glu-tRNA(Gln) amidotransferase subunit GatE [Candidatus ainarchaeum sp.]